VGKIWLHRELLNEVKKTSGKSNGKPKVIAGMWSDYG
jgi:hypothetical protein